MATFVILFCIILIIIIGLCLLFSLVKKEAVLKTDSLVKHNLGWKGSLLLIASLGCIIASFFTPFILTRESVSNNFDFSQTGQIGDTIGGLMNPFISIAAVIVTGLAFYIQYKANQQQRDLFELELKENKSQLQNQIDNQNTQNKRQQFEAQFYEMLRLHRENITEMKINGYDYEETARASLRKFEKITEGRKIFVVMKTELECIIGLYTTLYKLDEIGFTKCYEVFFGGIEEFKKRNPKDTNFIHLLSKARENHENPLGQNIQTNKDRKEFLNECKLYFNYKPFSGHSQRLGHYFRHLYLTVKSIAQSDVITIYEERIKYLRILRAQLSNHEQILLFYNWLSDYGNDWENDKQNFFTEYCMIHNLWYVNLYDDKFISNKVNYLKNKEVKFRKGLMFEFDALDCYKSKFPDTIRG